MHKYVLQRVQPGGEGAAYSEYTARCKRRSKGLAVRTDK